MKITFKKATSLLFGLFLLATASAATIHFCTTAIHILVYSLDNGFADTPIFVKAALTFLQTGNLYDMSEPLKNTYFPGSETYKFPPLYILSYLPWLSRENGIPADIYNILFMLHLLRYIVTICLSILFFGTKSFSWALAVTSIYFLAGPFYESLYGLTFDSLLLTLLIVAYILKKHRLATAGLLMYSILAKLYPAPLLLYYLQKFHNKKQTWLLLAGTAIAITLIATLATGINVQQIYFVKILPIILDKETLLSNYNLSFIAKLYAEGIPVIFSRLFFLAASIGIILTIKECRIENNTDALIWGFCISTTVLLIPNCWGNYQTILLLPIIILLGHAWDPKQRSRTAAGLAGLSKLSIARSGIHRLYCPWNFRPAYLF